MWTHKSSLIVGGGLLSQAVGIVFNSYVLAAVGTAMVIWVAWAYLLRRRASFEGRHDVSNERLFEGDTVQVTADLSRHGLGFGWVEVRDPLPPSVQVAGGSNYVIMPLSRRQPKLEYDLHLPIRGLYSLGPVETRNTGIFALFEDKRRFGTPSGLVVLPRGEILQEAHLKSLYPMQFVGEHSVRSPGIGTNFYALRDYNANDEMRMVNWKATARTGKLVVNQWERETLSEVTFFIDARAVAGLGTVGHNPLLMSARAASSLCELFLKGKNTIRLIVYGHQVRHLHSGGGEQQLFRVLAELAEAEPEGDIPFSDALHRTLHFLKPKSPVWIFSGLSHDADLAAGIAMLGVERNPVYLVSPDAVKCVEQAGVADEEEIQERRIERNLGLQAARGMGAHVIDWDPDEQFSLALHLGEVAA